MRTLEFLKLLEEDLPLALAMPDDPVGLQVIDADREIARVGVAYELDMRTVEEASERGIDLLIVFHPLIYPSLATVTPFGRVGQVVIELIRRRIALHVVHTAFDAHPRGTSRLLAERLGLRDIAPIVPSTVIEGAGMGAIGTLPEAATLDELGAFVAHATGSKSVRLSTTGSGDRMQQKVRRIAILGGSGMSFYSRAVAAGAEAFITADVRYHGFHEANDAIPVIDPGHAESEITVVEGMAAIVSESIKRNGLAIDLVPILVSTNPVHYICI